MSPNVKRWITPFVIFITVIVFNPILSYAQPAITTFTPVRGTVGTTVTITGTGFNATAANNVVYFGATRASVTSSTATRITAVVPYGATYSPIKVLVNGLSTASSASFTPVFQNIDALDESSFDNRVNMNTTSDPLAVAIGDFDGDGKADIVSANNNAGSVSVFRNVSVTPMITTASFATKVDFATGQGCTSVAIEDFDGDGKPDIVTANFSTGMVSVLRNTSSPGVISASSFAAKIDFAVGGGPNHVSVADIDKDGKPDIITSNVRGGQNGSISILKNLSTAGVINASSFAANVDFTVNADPTGLATADLNMDGKPELVVTNLNGFNISVFHNKSAKGVINAASLSPKVDFPAGANPFKVAVGDLTNDGKPEIGVVTYGNVLRLFLNETTSGAITVNSFATYSDFKTSTSPINIAMSDFTGDGQVDVAVTTHDANTVNLFMNSYDQSLPFSQILKEGIQIPTGAGPESVAIGDVNEDGKPEMIVTNSSDNTLSVIRNIGLAPVIESIEPASATVGEEVLIKGKFFSSIISENTVFIGNKRADLVYASPTELTIIVPTGIGNNPVTVTVNELVASSNVVFHTKFVSTGVFENTLADVGAYTVGRGPWAVASADFNGDGLLDLCTVNKTDKTMSVFQNISDGTFFMLDTRVDYATGNNPLNITTADIDGDGRHDVITAGGTTMSIFRNISTNNDILFQQKFDITVAGAQLSDVEVHDIDNDGKPELLLVSEAPGNNKLYVFKNRASGVFNATSFSPRYEFEAGVSPASVTARDLNNDGRSDIIVCNRNSHSVSVFENVSARGALSSGSVSARIDYALDFSPSEAIIGDVDEDGKPDILACNNYGHKVSILRNKSSGTISTSSFATRVDLLAGPNTSPSSIVFEDFDGDGKSDIGTTNNVASAVAIFRNKFSVAFSENSFAEPISYWAGWQPHAMISGDFNNDGKPDVALVNLFDNLIRVQLNTTDDVIRINTPAVVSYVQPDFTSQQVNVNVTGGTGDVIVTLRHRKITEDVYDETPCTFDGEIYSADIVPGMLDELGVEYFFEATDVTGIPHYSDEHSFIYKEVVNDLIDPIPFGRMDGSFGTYQLFSIPYILDNNSVSAAFTALGQYDKTRWRMFNYINGSYKEFNSEFFTLETGRGYWLTSKDNTPIKTGNGKVVEANQSKPFTIAIERGWNQIGNPFPFNVDWESVRDLEANQPLGLNSLFTYDNGGYLLTSILQTWRGGFVFSENQGTMSIPVTSKSLSGGRKAKETLPKEIDNDRWMLQMDLQSQELRATMAVGMHPNADFSKDQYDEIVMPRFSEYLDASTYHPEYFGPDFSYDVIPTLANHYWDITISSSKVNEPIKITWDENAIRNSMSALILIDLSDMSFVDMKKNGSYSIRYNGQRTLRVLFSRDSNIDHGLSAIGQAYPNPFNEFVTIPVFYPKGEQTTEILIYDLNGKPVTSIVNTNDTDGIWLANWYGRRQDGEVCPNGLYLYCLKDEKGNVSKMKKVIKNF